MSKREELIKKHNDILLSTEWRICAEIGSIYLYNEIMPIMGAAREVMENLARYDSYISRVGSVNISQHILDRKMEDAAGSIETLRQLIAEFKEAERKQA